MDTDGQAGLPYLRELDAVCWDGAGLLLPLMFFPDSATRLKRLIWPCHLPLHVLCSPMSARRPALPAQPAVKSEPPFRCCSQPRRISWPAPPVWNSTSVACAELKRAFCATTTRAVFSRHGSGVAVSLAVPRDFPPPRAEDSPLPHLPSYTLLCRRVGQLLYAVLQSYGVGSPPGL